MQTSELHPREVEPAGFTIIDVRTPAEFASGHIGGAVNVPLADLDDALPLLRGRAEDGRLLVVCASGARSAQACTALAGAGIASTALTGGTNAWQTEGRGLARVPGTRQMWPMDRQVRFTAGSIVVGAVLLDLVLPGARWVAAGVGGGLAFSAVSNTCAMAALLSKLPHNRMRSSGPGWRTLLAAPAGD